MRKNFHLLSCAAICAALVLSSCNSGKESKKEEMPADSATVKTEVPKGPAHRLIVMHKVADYGKWLAAYEAHDSMRMASGVRKYIIGRGSDDSNMVMMAMWVDDVAKAKAFGASEDLKTTMKNAGVIGAPLLMDIGEDEFMDTSIINTTKRIMIRHKVKDYDAWKKIFDSDKEARNAAGLTDRVLSRSVDDKNMVTIVMAYADLEKAKAFSTSKALQDKMKEGGVEGKPEVIFFDIVKKY